MHSSHIANVLLKLKKINSESFVSYRHHCEGYYYRIYLLTCPYVQIMWIEIKQMRIFRNVCSASCLTVSVKRGKGSLVVRLVVKNDNGMCKILVCISIP